jgi:hypothetical protein
MKPTTVQQYIKRVEELHTKIMTSELSAVEKALVLAGAAATAAAMARCQIDNEVELID